MNIVLRIHATGETRVISYNEFKDRVRRGEVFPEDQVQDRVLTNDQWWTVANLRIFHSLCPISHTKGPHLVAREKAEEEKHRLQEIARMQATERAALARKFFRVDQSESDIVLSSHFRFLTACNEQPLAGHDFAVRFTYLPSFHTPLFVRASRLGAEWELHHRAGSDSETGRSVVTREEVERVFNLAEAANLAAMSSHEHVHGLDGATWALEIARQGVYKLRYRWSPTHDTNERRLVEFVALGKYLVELSDLGQSTDEMY